MCSALVPSCGLCRIFADRTRHTQCVGHLFLGVCSRRTFVHVAYVGSLLIERGIHSI